MNRLQHFVRAKTVYQLHSPYVYALCTGALYARAEGAGSRHTAAGATERLRRYLGARVVPDRLGGRLTAADAELLVVDHPHRDEARWEVLKGDLHWEVALDLFTVGILIHRQGLHRQLFFLY